MLTAVCGIQPLPANFVPEQDNIFVLALIALTSFHLTMMCHSRRRCWEVTEAVLASILMAALLVAVLGMPIGAPWCTLFGTSKSLHAEY